MMHSRRLARRGVAGVGLAVPLALAPVLDVTVRTRAQVSPPQHRAKRTGTTVAATTVSRKSPTAAPERHHSCL
jgi:hypothetical protein